MPRNATKAFRQTLRGAGRRSLRDCRRRCSLGRDSSEYHDSDRGSAVLGHDTVGPRLPERRADPARTGWIQNEKVFTLQNMDTTLLWRIKLNSQPRQMHNLLPPLIADRVTTARGVREMAIVAGVSDKLFGIDVESGEVVGRDATRARSCLPPARCSTRCVSAAKRRCRRWNRSPRGSTRSTPSGGTAGSANRRCRWLGPHAARWKVSWTPARDDSAER